MRRSISSSSLSLSRAGAVRSLLSSRTETEATLRAGFDVVPPKMTSSMSPPRSRRAEVSPMTHCSASTRFDLPQPLGPTMPVSPASIRSSVWSTNDLKPLRRSLVNCKSDQTLPDRSGGGVEQLLELVVFLEAGRHRPVDEEGRRRIDAGVVAGLTIGHDQCGELGIGEAALDLRLGHAADLGELGQFAHGLIGVGPIPGALLGIEHVEEAVEPVRAAAMGDDMGLERHRIEREIAEDPAHLAGIDPILLHLREGLHREIGAVRAGERGIFDDRDLRIGLAQDHVVRTDRGRCRGTSTTGVVGAAASAWANAANK